MILVIDTHKMDQLSAALSLMRRLPPKNVEQNLTGLLNLLPDQMDELLQRIDQPLEEETDPETGRKYLRCDYNRDGDSYRSPWSNKYHPPIEDGFLPSEELRPTEIEANELFDAYRELYYEGGTSSVYLWDLDDGFAGCFLVKKAVTTGAIKGTWDAIHVVEAHEDAADATKATYKLTTTVMLGMDVTGNKFGACDLAGSLTRQAEKEDTLGAGRSHISNIGRMIEAMEGDMRSNLNELYLAKTREIVSNIRGNEGPKLSDEHVSALNAAIKGHTAPTIP